MSEDEITNASTESRYSPQQRRSLLKQFLGKTKTLQGNVDKCTISSLQNIMIDADTINADESITEKVNRTDEVLLDSEMICMSSEVIKRCTETLKKDTSPYNCAEFADKILSYVQLRPDTILEEPHWSILADDLLQCLNATPNYSYLLGTLKPLEKKPAVKRKHRRRDAQVATKRPENIQTVDKVEDGVEETVQRIKILVSEYYKQDNEPLDFFKLILNPVSFGRTVENMLHVSFLIRDGYFKLVKDDKAKLILRPTTKAELAQTKKNGNDGNIQNVMSIGADEWKSLTAMYMLKEPMIRF